MNEPMTNPTSPAFPPPPPAASTTPPAPPVAYAPSYVKPIKSPAVAGILSLLPGLGHVYLGLYKRAAVFFAIWVITFAVVDEVGGPLGLFIPFWWFFVLIDAVRQAQAINACCPPTAELPADFKLPAAGGNLALGVFLILFGVFFILKKLVVIDLDFLRVWWPMVFILFGAWQVFVHFKEKQESERPKSEETAL